MGTASPASPARRRAVLRSAGWGVLAALGAAAAPRRAVAEQDGPVADEALFIEQLTGKTPTASSRVQLRLPPAFGNGYGVPLALSVHSPMTEADYVRSVTVLAPGNPIVVVARFQFTPQSGRAAVATRIRLAAPQNVIALAEMSDESLLMARSWVKVDTDGCQ